MILQCYGYYRETPSHYQKKLDLFCCNQITYLLHNHCYRNGAKRMKAISYRRVSAQEQIDGTSLRSQGEQARAYAALKGMDLIEVLTDAGVSGGCLSRTGLQDAGWSRCSPTTKPTV